MVYTPQTWSDSPSTATPISAARLQYIEDGVAALGVLSSYTPSWTNLTVGNGTVAASYAQIGKVVYLSVILVFGSTTAVSGEVSFTLPVTASGVPIKFLGSFVSLQDSGTATYLGTVVTAGTGTIWVRSQRSDGTYLMATGGSLSSTSPFTWTTGDSIQVGITYEAAA